MSGKKGLILLSEEGEGNSPRKKNHNSRIAIKARSRKSNFLHFRSHISCFILQHELYNYLTPPTFKKDITVGRLILVFRAGRKIGQVNRGTCGDGWRLTGPGGTGPGLGYPEKKCLTRGGKGPPELRPSSRSHVLPSSDVFFPYNPWFLRPTIILTYDRESRELDESLCWFICV